MSDNQYYVYQHFDNNGNLFYVGKGKGKRGFECRGGQRNDKWFEMARDGFSVKILKDNLSNDDALALEKETIYEAIGAGIDLANNSPIERYTVVVGAQTGRVKTQEEKDKISASKKKTKSRRLRTKNNQAIIGTCIATGEEKTFYGHQELIAAGFNQGNVSGVCYGRWSQHKGWKFRFPT